MKAAESLYFIALVPPEPIYSKVLAYKRYFAEKYTSKAALKSPPHVTLHMPFRLKSKRENELINSLQNIGHLNTSFDLVLDCFGAFEPRVVYVNVANNNSLVELQKSIHQLMKLSFNTFNAAYRDRPFRPHMTVAFRDLKKDKFEIAWEEFKDNPFQAEYLATNFSLLKHNGKIWEVLDSFNLRGT